MIKTKQAQLKKNIKSPTPILDALKKYIQNPPVALHIPGHAGNFVLHEFKELIGSNAIKLDMPDGFANIGTLYPASDAIKESQKLTAKLFRAKQTFFLLNGSTIGNIALALTVTKQGSKTLIARNCHRSIINGIILSGADPCWLMPKRLDNWGIWGQIRLEDIKKAVAKNPEISSLWLTNPTYEGIISDIKPIAKFCREKNITLIVDEAHGSLWNFNSKLPQSGLAFGADAVVNSMHKTAGSFTQSSLLHLSHGSKINPAELEANLKALHTTSPSMLLLASIDAARAYMDSKDGQQAVEKAVKNAEFLRMGLEKIDNVECLNNKNIDTTKIYLKIKGLSGKRIKSILEIEHNIEIETATDRGILALSNLGNSRQDIEKFLIAINSIARKNYSDIGYLEKNKFIPFTVPELAMNPRIAHNSIKESVEPVNALGRIAGETVAACPPGISILIPGEIIKKEHLDYLGDIKSILVVKNIKGHL